MWWKRDELKRYHHQKEAGTGANTGKRGGVSRWWKTSREWRYPVGGCKEGTLNTPTWVERGSMQMLSPKKNVETVGIKQEKKKKEKLICVGSGWIGEHVGIRRNGRGGQLLTGLVGNPCGWHRHCIREVSRVAYPTWSLSLSSIRQIDGLSFIQSTLRTCRLVRSVIKLVLPFSFAR